MQSERLPRMGDFGSDVAGVEHELTRPDNASSHVNLHHLSFLGCTSFLVALYCLTHCEVGGRYSCSFGLAGLTSERTELADRGYPTQWSGFLVTLGRLLILSQYIKTITIQGEFPTLQ